MVGKAPRVVLSLKRLHNKSRSLCPWRRAHAAAGVRPLRFHDLRHTFGSLLAASGVDVVTIQKAMGHSALATTSRYLHARPASEQAQAFTAAFTSSLPEPADRVAR